MIKGFSTVINDPRRELSRTGEEILWHLNSSARPVEDLLSMYRAAADKEVFVTALIAEFVICRMRRASGASAENIRPLPDARQERSGI